MKKQQKQKIEKMLISNDWEIPYKNFVKKVYDTTHVRMYAEVNINEHLLVMHVMQFWYGKGYFKYRFHITNETFESSEKFNEFIKKCIMKVKGRLK